MPEIPHFPSDWEIAYYNENEKDNDLKTVKALFEYPERKLSTIVMPDEKRDGVITHEVIHVYPFDSDSSIFPMYYSNIFNSLERSLLSIIPDVKPIENKNIEEKNAGPYLELESNTPHGYKWSIGSKRRYLLDFSWSSYPTEFYDNSSFTDFDRSDMEEELDFLLDNIKTSFTLKNLLEHYPERVDNPYPVDLVVEEIDGETVIHPEISFSISFNKKLRYYVNFDKIKSSDYEGKLLTLYVYMNDGFPHNIVISNIEWEDEAKIYKTNYKDKFKMKSLEFIPIS